MSLTNPVAREPSASIASSIAGSVVDGAVYPSHALPWGADNVFRNATAFTSDLETTSEAGLFSGYFRIDNGSRNTTKYIFRQTNSADGSGSNGFTFQTNGTTALRMYFRSFSARIDYNTPLANNDTWFHILFLHDSVNDRVKLYIDGVMVEDESVGGPGQAVNAYAVKNYMNIMGGGTSDSAFDSEAIEFKQVALFGCTAVDVQDFWDADSAIETAAVNYFYNGDAVSEPNDMPLTGEWNNITPQLFIGEASTTAVNYGTGFEGLFKGELEASGSWSGSALDPARNHPYDIAYKPMALVSRCYMWDFHWLSHELNAAGATVFEPPTDWARLHGASSSMGFFNTGAGILEGVKNTTVDIAGDIPLHFKVRTNMYFTSDDFEIRLYNADNVANYCKFQFSQSDSVNSGVQTLVVLPSLAAVATANGGTLAAGSGMVDNASEIAQVGTGFDPASNITRIDFLTQGFTSNQSSTATAADTKGQLLEVAQGYNHTPVMYITQDDGRSSLVSETYDAGDPESSGGVNFVDYLLNYKMFGAVNLIGDEVSGRFSDAQYGVVFPAQEIARHTSYSLTTKCDSSYDVSVDSTPWDFGEDFHSADGLRRMQLVGFTTNSSDVVTQGLFDLESGYADFVDGDVVTGQTTGCVITINSAKQTTTQAQYEQEFSRQKTLILEHATAIGVPVSWDSLQEFVYAEGGYRNNAQIGNALRNAMVAVGVVSGRSTVGIGTQIVPASDVAVYDTGLGAEHYAQPAIGIESTSRFTAATDVTAGYLEEVARHGGLHWLYYHTVGAVGTTRTGTNIPVDELFSVASKMADMRQKACAKVMRISTYHTLINRKMPEANTPFNSDF
tara:strand:+ start:11393 stop:13924 length:2532 start_codon:yes stop_codon:yes gene_type:complete